MANIHRLPDVDDAEREASEWIARLDADDASADDRARFEAWRQAHPRHARAYEELSATWRQFTDAGRLVRAVALGQALGFAETPRTARRTWLLATAATVVAALIGWWWVERMTPQTLFQTAIGEHAAIDLPDESLLELNSNSLVRVGYTQRARVVSLERGEAFFDVEHDAQRPFWVLAGGSWVRAVGTAFNVHVRSTGVRVTVSEGMVKVAAKAPSNGKAPNDQQLAQAAVAVLTAGQQVDVHGAATEVRSLAPGELTRSVAWRSGTLYFENEPLSDVVNELSRYTTLPLVVEDDALRDLYVGGTFQSNPQGAEALLTMLEDGFGLQIRRDDGSVYIAQPQSQ